MYCSLYGSLCLLLPEPKCLRFFCFVILVILFVENAETFDMIVTSHNAQIFFSLLLGLIFSLFHCLMCLCLLIAVRITYMVLVKHVVKYFFCYSLLAIFSRFLTLWSRNASKCSMFIE